MLDHLFEIHNRNIEAVSLDFKRFLFQAVDWDARLAAVIGQRGTGKTTMLLQYAALRGSNPQQCLYLSADNVRVQAQGLYETAAAFVRGGGEVLLIDEVHRYPSWSVEIKSIYDAFPKVRMILSGSSSLDLLKGGADLSRRLVSYKLPGLSFREFVCLRSGVEIDPVKMEPLLQHHHKLAGEIQRKLDDPVMKCFGEYLAHGYYPFHLEGTKLYALKLANVIEKVVSEDIPSVFAVRPVSLATIRKLLHLVASSQPFVPNIERMASSLQTSKESVYNYLAYLQGAGLLAGLRSPGRGFKAVRKPAKLYLDNPNLFHALLSREERAAVAGTVRESFFYNQVGSCYPLVSDAKVDFRIEEGVGFEIGGRSKSEIGLPPDCYLAVDDTEVGSGRRIPLWLFGFLY